jgi:hypothetical protein
VKRSISADIRTPRVARSKGEWIRLSQCVKGGFGTTVSFYRNGENRELLCVFRSAWAGSPPRSILHRLEKMGFQSELTTPLAGLWRPLLGKEELKPPERKRSWKTVMDAAQIKDAVQRLL